MLALQKERKNYTWKSLYQLSIYALSLSRIKYFGAINPVKVFVCQVFGHGAIDVVQCSRSCPCIEKYPLIYDSIALFVLLTLVADSLSHRLL